MALAETAKLVVDLSLQGNFLTQTGKINSALSKLDAKLSSTESRAYRAGQQIGTGIKRSAYLAVGAIGFLASQVAFGVASLDKLEQAEAQTNAVLKSTKGIAGETAQSIRDLANKYEALNSTISDEVIQSGENLLLTFTNIRKNAFEPTLQAALDLNTALGRGQDSLTDTIRAVGRALNDPAKGLVLLTRLGIQFTDAQKKQIDAALKANDTFKAQSIILAELNRRFGGSFLAQGNTTAGKIAKFKDAIDDLQRALAEALLPAIGKVADALGKFLRDPKVLDTVRQLGDEIAGLFSDQNLASGADFLKELFGTAKDAAPIVAAAAKATFAIIQQAVGLFRSLPPEIQKLAIGAFAINKITGGLVTNLASGLISSVLKSLVSGVVNVQGGVVNVAGGAGAVAAGAAGKGGSVVSAISKVFLVGAAIGVFAELRNALADLTASNKTAEQGLTQQTALYVQSASLSDMQRALAAIKDTSKLSLAENFAIDLNIDGVRDSIVEQQHVLEAAINAQIAAQNIANDSAISEAEKTRQAINTRGVATTAAVNAARTAERTGADRIRAAVFGSGSSLAAKIAGTTKAVDYSRRAQIEAIKNKRLSVTVPVSVTTTVSVRDYVKSVTKFGKWGLQVT